MAQTTQIMILAIMINTQQKDTAMEPKTKHHTYTCPYTCTGGKCNQQQNTCTDSDGGLNFTVFGWVYGIANDTNYMYNDTCHGNQLTERYCS